MKKINDLLKKNNIRGTKYTKKGKCIVVEDKDSKVVIKTNKTDIYNYLNYRNFNQYPNLMIDSGYEISEYIEDIDIPREQKMIDLINLIASLHKKTTYYKKISEYDIKDTYEDLKDKVISTRYFYDNLMNEVENSVYMRPSYYLLARNISFVYQMLDFADKNIDKWYNVIKETDRIRVAVIHNNLSLDHLLNNTLISWDKSKIALPILDLYKLYQNTYNEYDWNELLDIYNSDFPLKSDELFLFYSLIAIPITINITNIEIDNVREVNNKLTYLKSTYDFLITKKSEIEI